MKWIKAIAIYMSYFGTQYISNDIRRSCAHLLNNSIAKTITLISIMYLVFDRIDLSIYSAFILLFLQINLTKIIPCQKCGTSLSSSCDCKCSGCYASRSSTQRLL